jgi:hypothetical protein
MMDLKETAPASHQPSPDAKENNEKPLNESSTGSIEISNDIAPDVSNFQSRILSDLDAL